MTKKNYEIEVDFRLDPSKFMEKHGKNPLDWEIAKKLEEIPGLEVGDVRLERI